MKASQAAPDPVNIGACESSNPVFYPHWITKIKNSRLRPVNFSLKAFGVTRGIYKQPTDQGSVFLLGMALALMLAGVAPAYGKTNLPPHVRAALLQREIVTAVKHNDLKRVVAAIEQYKKLDVSMPPAFLLVEAKAEFRLGESVRALSTLQVFLGVASQNSQGYREAIDLYPTYQQAARARSIEEARVDAEQALNRARAEYKTGHYVEALADLKSAIRAAPQGSPEHDQTQLLLATYQAAAQQEAQRRTTANRDAAVKKLVQSILSAGFEFVPGGKFRMGWPGGPGWDGDHGYDYKASIPVHTVRVSPFRILKSPITCRDYTQYMILRGGRLLRNGDVVNADDTSSLLCADGATVGYVRADRFVRWLSHVTGEIFHLPSEAQWEYLARRSLHLGSYVPMKDAVAYSDFFALTDVPNWIAGFRGGPDLDWDPGAGTWVADCWHDNYIDAPTDGSAWEGKRDCVTHVIRGHYDLMSWRNWIGSLEFSVKPALYVRTRQFKGADAHIYIVDTN